MSIEALARNALPLSLDHLLWIGYPHICETEVCSLMSRHWPNRVVRWRYDVHQFFRPMEVETLLEANARQFVEGYI